MKPSASKSSAKPGSVSSNTTRARVWGLTGGIASGKSEVARFFAEAGVAVIDADQIARELRAPGGAAHKAILRRFGTTDPMRLREIVFKDERARSELEAIMHPLIRAESAKKIQDALASAAKSGQAHQGSVPVIYEAALLVETRRCKDFAGLIVVSADENLRLSRLMARDKSPEELARKILSAQIQDKERRAHATFVIENHGSLDELKAQVLKIVPQLS
jgi:dephospho-CoA kinase